MAGTGFRMMTKPDASRCATRRSATTFAVNLGRLASLEGATTCEAKREADFDVAGMGGGELVIVGHDGDDS